MGYFDEPSEKEDSQLHSAGRCMGQPFAGMSTLEGQERQAPSPWSEKGKDGCTYLAVVVKANGIPFWLVGEFTTQFGTYFSGWIGGLWCEALRPFSPVEAILVPLPGAGSMLEAGGGGGV